jgi:hypothetical protein
MKDRVGDVLAAVTVVIVAMIVFGVLLGLGVRLIEWAWT